MVIYLISKGVVYMTEKVELFNQNKLRIALTNACNLSCFYCHNEGQKIGCAKQFLSYQYTKQMVEFIIKIMLGWIISISRVASRHFIRT